MKCSGEFQDYPAHLSEGQVAVGHRAICSRQRNLQRDLLRRVSGISARGSVSFKATCCGESQEYPLAPERLPKEHAAGILSLIRPRKVIFQRDMLRSVTGLSARASALSTGSCFREPQEYQSASGHLSTWKILRGVLGQIARFSAPSKGTCCVEFQNNPLARDHLFN